MAGIDNLDTNKLEKHIQDLDNVIDEITTALTITMKCAIEELSSAVEGCVSEIVQASVAILGDDGQT